MDPMSRAKAKGRWVVVPLTVIWDLAWRPSNSASTVAGPSVMAVARLAWSVAFLAVHLTSAVTSAWVPSG
jgi:hypothetical protein